MATWRSSAALALLISLSLGVFSCHEDLDRFDTGESDAYCGSIISSEFTRKGYDSDLTMRLTLDIENINTEPGKLSLQDASSGPCRPLPTFDQAPLRTTPALFADPLSELQFGQSREHNFMGWIDSECEESALAIVSLMHDGAVEVRLVSRGASKSEGGDFGVFQLTRNACDD